MTDATPTSGRKSQLIGDRLCIRCGFNLHGQDIFREETYGMLVVRCPECATLASMQEYPVASRWAGKLGVLMIAIWMMALVGAFAGTTFAAGGFISEIINELSYNYAEIIARKHHDWYVSLADEQKQALSIRNAGPRFYSQIDPTWAAQLDHPALIREHGGRWRVLDTDAFAIMLIAALVLIPIGAAWSVVLSHIRRTRLALLGTVPPIIAGALVWMTSFDPFSRGNALRLATDHLFPLVGPIALVTLIGLLAGGLVFGRSIARVAVRLLLPPRLRGLTAFLWRADGLTPPSTLAARATPRNTR